MHIVYSSGMPGAKSQAIELGCPECSNAARRVPQTLPEILRVLALIDGASCWHGAQYYSTSGTQELARYRTAKALLLLDLTERARRLEVMRTWTTGETRCAYCENEFLSLAGVVAIGGKLLHSECARLHDREYAAWIQASIEITLAGREALAADEVAS